MAPPSSNVAPPLVVVTKVSLFRCLLHINAARKVVTVHLMPRQQLFLRSFGLYPPSFQTRRTRLPLQSFLEGSFGGWDANLRFASHVREDFHPQTSLHVLLICGTPYWTFITYWLSPRMVCCPQIGPWPNILVWASTPTTIYLDRSHQLLVPLKKYFFETAGILKDMKKRESRGVNFGN